MTRPTIDFRPELSAFSALAELIMTIAVVLALSISAGISVAAWWTR